MLRWLRNLGRGVWVLLALIGLAGLPEDISKWSVLLSHIDSDTGRLLLVGAAVVLFAAVELVPRVKGKGKPPPVSAPSAPVAGSIEIGQGVSRTIVRPQSRVLPLRQAGEGQPSAPALPDRPVRVALSDEASRVVAAELAEHGPRRAEPIDTARLARRLREHHSRGRPILTDAENAPDRGEVYRVNQRFIKWGEEIEQTLTSQLFHDMAAFAVSLERADPPPPRFSLSLEGLLGSAPAGGRGGHAGLQAHVRERLDRLQALIQALEAHHPGASGVEHAES